jgi:archaellum component FlaF (FlaF/FlaG flagellin family)
MGFGNLVGQAIIALAVFIIAAFLIVNYTTYIEDVHDELQMEKERAIARSKGNITILSSEINSNLINLTVKNTGKLLISDINDTEVYIDNIRMNRSSKNIYLIASYDITNPNMLDPDEAMAIEISKDLSYGSHKIRVLANEDVYDEATATLS